MRFRKIMLITLLLLAVLTIGAASAADVDAIAVNDTGDEDVIEAPADEDVVENPIVDEDAVEAEEDNDVLASPYASFGDEIYSDYHTVVSFSNYGEGINGTVSLLANDTQVYNQEIVGEEYISIEAKDIIGSFFGTYNMKIIYNGADGTNYDKEGTVTFTKAFINKVFTPEDFQVTFPSDVVDLGKNPVIFTYFWPEGVKEHISSIKVVYDEEDMVLEALWDPQTDPVNVYKNVTWGNLNRWDTGVFNISVYYCEDWEPVLLLGNATLKIVQTYYDEDFIYVYDFDVTSPEDYIAEVYDPEIKGLDGVVTVYADGVQVYTKTYNNYPRGGPIQAGNLTGYFDGTYNIKVVYKRTDGREVSQSQNVKFINMVAGDSISTSISVAPQSVSMAYNTNKYLVATLKDSTGKPIKDAQVYVTVMGVSIPLKTDKNGQVKQSLANLPPKTHYVSFAFKDAAPYKASTSKKVTVKVSKATPKLTAAKKTFKKSVKTKKYTITLKTNTNKVLKNAKVKLTVNKKTYTAKTNNKGKATFKITNLKKKGTFKATVKYAGNSYYKAKSVKVKITVK